MFTVDNVNIIELIVEQINNGFKMIASISQPILIQLDISNQL